MKKGKWSLLVILMAVMLLAGCKGPKFTFTTTTVLDKTTIEIKEAKDDEYVETDYISVGKNRIGTVESSLDKGELKIDFVEATVFDNDDGPDDVMTGDVVSSVTVGPGETKEVEIERGDYVMQCTTIGETNGKVVVHFDKK